MKIAIIGGGMAGLGSAYELAKENGFEVSIFERSNKLGGLASSINIEDTHLEVFYHHMFPDYHDIFEVVRETGIEGKMFFKKASTANYFEKKIYPFDSPIDLLRFKPLSFFDRLKTGFVILYLRLKRNAKDLENITAEEWLNKYLSKRSYNVIWEPLLQSKFGKFYKEVSMAWLWSRIYERPTKFGYFYGGFETLIEALRKNLLQKKVKINLESKILDIKKESSSYVLTTAERSQSFDQIIVATSPIPFLKIANDFLPEEYKNKLKKFRYVGTVVGILLLKKKLTSHYWTNINEKNPPFIALVEQTNFVDSKTYGGLHPVYLARYVDPDDPFYNQTEEKTWEVFLKKLKEIIPEFNQDWIEKKLMFKAPFTQPVIPVNYSSVKPNFKTPVSGLWWVSMSHIYPWDRGTNRSFRYGRDLAKELIEND